MSTPAPAAEHPDTRRRQLVAALVVAVVLLLGSVLAAIAWAPRGPVAFVPDRGWSGPAWRGFDERRAPDDAWAERMDRMHDLMHGDDAGAPPWWWDGDDEATPAPSPTD